MNDSTFDPRPAELRGQDAGASVDKIRDILFGGQMREYETRFTDIEQRLFSESAQMREDLTQRLSRMEVELRAELRRLGEAGLKERSERLQMQQAADLQLATLGQDLLMRLSELDRTSSEELNRLRESTSQNLASASHDFADQLARLDQRHENGKTGKEELAGLLRNIAERLAPPTG